MTIVITVFVLVKFWVEKTLANEPVVGQLWLKRVKNGRLRVSSAGEVVGRQTGSGVVKPKWMHWRGGSDGHRKEESWKRVKELVVEARVAERLRPILV